MVDALCTDREKLLTFIRERLGAVPSDFATRFSFIRSTERSSEVHLAAGVLLLLHYRPAGAAQYSPGFCFQLIKRSARVAQGGDLSCPGGMLDHALDPLLSLLIKTGIVPLLTGKARRYVRQRGRDTYRAITLFLTNAVRESWEELGLNPYNIGFLGPLPCYSLIMFRRTIFPLVGFTKRQWQFRPNREVDKVVEIPLTAFFRQENYGRLRIEASPELGRGEGPRESPCLIQRDADGKEDVLWGATFNIIMSFLKIVFDFQPPDFSAGPVVKRLLRPEYLTGKR